MTDPRKPELPEGLVDVSRCIAEAGELRRKSWDDPGFRRFGLGVLAAQFAIVGLAVLAAVAVTHLPTPGGVQVAETRASELGSPGGFGTR
jgi:hypothetical protein